MNLETLEQSTIQFDGIGIRHKSICNNGIGHNHYFGLGLIPPTQNELCLIPTYSVSLVPNSIGTIGPYSVCLSSATLSDSVAEYLVSTSVRALEQHAMRDLVPSAFT